MSRKSEACSRPGPPAPTPGLQQKNGKGVGTRPKGPHFEFRNCGERVSSVGSWGERSEGSGLGLSREKLTPSLRDSQ